MKPIFMDQLLQLNQSCFIFNIDKNRFGVHLSRKDALDLLEYNNLTEFNVEKIKDLRGKKIYDFMIMSSGGFKKTYIEIL